MNHPYKSPAHGPVLTSPPRLPEGGPLPADGPFAQALPVCYNLAALAREAGDSGLDHGLYRWRAGMKPAHLLYSLQQLDLEMASRTARLREIEAILASDQALEEARTALEAARRRLLQAQARQRDLELEAQRLASELQATEAQLYSGRVRNPKELEGLQGKAENLRKRRAAVDDRVLEAMIASEEAAAAAQEAEAALKHLEAEREATCKALAQEREDLEARLATLRCRREALVAGMPPGDLQAYEALRARRGSRPVALVQGKACQECGIALPTAVLQRAREGSELIRCPNCDRILCVVD